MIKVFYGNDRARIAQEVKKILGEDYEVFDGTGGLLVSDIVNIFRGNSLFSAKRRILIKDLTPARGSSAMANDSGANSGDAGGATSGTDFYEEISKYVDTPHTVAIWETTVSSKRTYKDFIKMPGVSVQKFEMAPKIDMRQIFEIFDTALVNGPRAVKMLEEVQGEEDPYMFFGLLASQAIRKFAVRQGRKERDALKMLSELDMQMKTTAVEPWVLIKAVLIRLSKA